MHADDTTLICNINNDINDIEINRQLNTISVCVLSFEEDLHVLNSLHGFKPKVWDKVREDVMLKLLRIKFAPGSDMATKLVATAGKSLAEAGQSVTFSIGMSLNNRDLFKTDKWTKNVLGKLLMKVREELS